MVQLGPESPKLAIPSQLPKIGHFFWRPDPLRTFQTPKILHCRCHLQPVRCCLWRFLKWGSSWMDDSGLNISTKLRCSIFTGCQSLPPARIRSKILQWQQTDINITQPFIEIRFFYFKLHDRFWKRLEFWEWWGSQGLLAKCSTNFPLLSFASVFQVPNVQIRAALGQKLETEY